MRKSAGFGVAVRLAALCVVLTFGAQQAVAQEIGAGESGFTGLPLDLLPPGARSLGLAGAFTAVADDATAALANPAGLTILTATELSVHVRNTDTSVGFLDPDAYDNGYFLSGSDDVQLVKGFDDSSTDLSFASFVKPFDRWVLSAFYTQQLNFSSNQNREDVFIDDEFLVESTNINSIDAKVQGYGLSAAFRATDRFSIGVSVARAELDISSVDLWNTDSGQFIALLLSGGNPQLLPAAKREVVDSYRQSTVIDGADANDLMFNIGLMFRPSDSWSIGLVYAKGAEFEVDTRLSGTYRAGCTGATALNAACVAAGVPGFDGAFDFSENTTTEINLPDVLTLGVAWRPGDTWLISFDAKRIGYGSGSQVRDITQGYGTDINDLAARAQLVNPEVTSLQGNITEEIKDETTFHLGVEKVFVRQNNNTFTVRAGGFTIEDVDGTPLIDSDDTAFTIGVGATFGEMGQFQLDLGASFADNTDNILLSGIYRF